MAFVGHVVASAPGRAARGLQTGRIGMDRLPAPERIPGRETVAASMDELDRTVAAEIVDGPGIPVDAAIAQGRRLALHDGTAARMRPDMDAVRRHHGNQRPAEPGRPPSIRVMLPCRRRGGSPGRRKTTQAGPCRPQESVGSGGVTSGRENRCEPGIRVMSCQGTPWIARLRGGCTPATISPGRASALVPFEERVAWGWCPGCAREARDGRGDMAG